jgi:site-specific recombinase XerD
MSDKLKVSPSDQSLKEYLQSNYAPSAHHGYYTMIKRFLDFTYQPETATYNDILKYLGYLRKQKAHPKTVRNHLFAIKIYFRYLVITGQREDHPCRHLYLKDQINRSIPLEELYSKEQLENFLQSHKSLKPYLQKRDEVIISLLIYQALSTSEISNLKTEDIDLDQGTIYVKGGAKQKSRELHLKARQIMLLHNYLSGTRKQIIQQNKDGETDFLILNYEAKRLEPISIRVIINTNREEKNQLKPIKIRQSVIYHLLKQNHDLRIVQVFAGHRTATSTEAYRQTGFEELKAAIQKNHPLQ